MLVENGNRGGRIGGEDTGGTTGGGPMEAAAGGAAAEAIKALLRLACVSGTPESRQHYMMHPFANTCAKIAQSGASFELCKRGMAVACMQLHADDVLLHGHGTRIDVSLWTQLLMQVLEELNSCYIVNSNRGKEVLC